MAKRIRKFYLIDGQFDFCDPSGALFVKGADEDSKRTAKFIDKFGENLNDMTFTLDSHHRMHIAHKIFWTNSKGENPNPFTNITLSDVVNGVWFPTEPSLRTWALFYLKALEDGKRYPHTIWPEHCLIGSKGNNLQIDIFEAMLRWEKKNIAIVNKVSKGSNFKTEHFSAVKAEVADPKDNSTLINSDIITDVTDADEVYIAGQALDY